MIKTYKVKLYPNAYMKAILQKLCDYRRYCWNQGLAIWNDMYEESKIMNDKTLRPTTYKVRNELVANKADWQYQYSARCLQLAITDLGHAWQNFFDRSQPDWGKPHFKSKKAPKQGFKTDRGRLIHHQLQLDKPQGVDDWFGISFKGYHKIVGKLKMAAITKKGSDYWASLTVETNVQPKPKIGNKTAIDVNVGHFNLPHQEVNILPTKLQYLYKQIKHYQRQLTKKRQVNGKLATQSHNYVKTRTKLQRDYNKVANIQHDLIQKLTTNLVNNNDSIVIEDLNVKQMQMSHVASKGLQRSLFSYFRQVLTYKCEWYGKQLIVADRYYPSTQRCSQCGYVKSGEDKITLQGNQKHHTKHNQYICYHCGAMMDRDENAVQNLLQLVK